MADINKIKIGAVDPDSIMFNKFDVSMANTAITFGSIIPKDNSSAATQEVSQSVWQINDGWEVEIISPKKIAIKKFKIDTWGIRQMIPNPHTNYNKLRVRVTGLNHVHQNVICHTAGSTKPDGFTKAYGGTAGYDVYWYPGHYTSGNSMQGMVIQFGCGYKANDNERYDSLQIGKHPWDIGTKVGIADGIIEGTWGDTDYKAITIGLYGGVQNAKSWHDETGDAYKQYDISDNPIYIDLNVDDVTKDIDVTSVECWDAYVGNDKSYHKDKTIDNCWKKYGLAVPFGWNLYKDNIKVNEESSNKNYDIEWKTPFRIYINKAIFLKLESDFIVIDSNYYNVNFKAFKLKITGKSNYTTINFTRQFINTTINESTIYTLMNGINEIESLNKTVNRKDNTKSAYISEFNLTINSTKEFSPITIDIIPVFEDTDRISINTNIWNSILPNMFVPEVTDYLNNMNKITWNNSFSNTALANSVKDWYKNNATNSNFKAGSIFKDSKKLTDITILLPNEDWLYGEDNFSGSDLETITIKQGGNKSHFTSPQRLFRNANKLKNINIIWSDSNNTSNYLCGANSVIEWMGGIQLTTYSERFINWNQNRTNVLSETIKCTLFTSAFNWAQKLVTIPSYPSDVEEDNTIIPARCVSYAFNECKSLKTVGPIFNMILANPKTADKLFHNCNVLSSIRIKNLNHGNWNFDGVTRDNMYHGTLKALDADSVKYLFDNLTDLTTHNSSVHEDAIDKSFKNWSSDYFDYFDIADGDYTLTDIRQFTCIKRYATKESAPFIVSTTAALNAMVVEVQGLQDGDSVIFGEDGNVEPIVTWTTNGNQNITKAANTNMGFKLISSNTDNRSNVTITIYNGLDYTNPNVSSANLYCPKEWGAFYEYDFTKLISEGASLSTDKVILSKRQTSDLYRALAYIFDSPIVNITITITGLINGDTLGVGTDTINKIKYKFTTDGTYNITIDGLWGFKLWNDIDTNNTSTVEIKCKSVPSKITSDMITNANLKGWTIYVNGVETKN
jgi:hypothetical protein